MDNDQEEYTVISLFTFRQIALWFFVAAIASCVGVFLLYYYKEKFDSPILPFNCLIIFFLGYFIGTYLTTIYRINNINLRKLILFIVPIIIFPLSVFYVTLLQLVIIQIIYWVGVIFGYLHFLIGGGKGQDEYKTTELLIDRLIYEANRYHDSGEFEKVYQCFLELHKNRYRLGYLQEYDVIPKDDEMKNYGVFKDLSMDMSDKKIIFFVSTAQDACKELGLIKQRAVLNYYLGRISEWSNDFVEAKKYYQKSRDLFISIEDDQYKILDDRITDI